MAQMHFILTGSENLWTFGLSALKSRAITQEDKINYCVIILSELIINYLLVSDLSTYIATEQKTDTRACTYRISVF
jgi:hypothetical protein